MNDVDTDALLLLLKAKSTEQVKTIFQEAILNKANPPELVVDKYAVLFAIQPFQARRLTVAAWELMKRTIYCGYSDPKQIKSFFPDGFHASLSDLLSKILIENYTILRNDALQNLASMPRLVDFDWIVNMKTSSDVLLKMAIPTCLLHLKIQSSKSRKNEEPKTSNFTVELTKDTLDIMLDSLGRIRHQLALIAK